MRWKTGGVVSESFDELNKLLPPHWSQGNPIDILGDASPETYAKAVEIVASDENNDGLLVILSPQAVTEPTETAERLRPFAKLKSKPVLASWIGGVGVRPGVEILDRAGIPTFEYPDAAARAFCAMWRYSHNLDALYETPALTATAEIDRSRVEQIINRARKSRARCSPKWNRSNCWRPTEFRPSKRKSPRAKRKLSILRKRSVARLCSKFFLKRSRTKATWVA